MFFLENRISNQILNTAKLNRFLHQYPPFVILWFIFLFHISTFSRVALGFREERYSVISMKRFFRT
ncbi:hypothetical protein CW304_20940 [Bacillus sp. UFRGS-B20]|nr:hypothetical protein CW304_20940 [Bacillus sp. UFRGS-B20]